MALRIEDYALIGDCQTAALVGKRRVDRLAVPAAVRLRCLLRRSARHAGPRPLAGRPGGRRSGPPAARYRGDTLVLETEFETDAGAVARHRLHAGPRRRSRTWSASSRGRAAASRSDRSWSSGSTTGRSSRGSSGTADGIRAVAGPGRRSSSAPRSETRGENLTTVAEFAVAEGQRVPFVLTWHRSYDPDPAADRRRGRAAGHARVVERVVRPVHLRRRVARTWWSGRSSR